MRAHDNGTDCTDRAHPSSSAPFLAWWRPDQSSVGPAFKALLIRALLLGTVTWEAFVKSPAPGCRAQFCKEHSSVYSRQPTDTVWASSSPFVWPWPTWKWSIMKYSCLSCSAASALVQEQSSFNELAVSSHLVTSTTGHINLFSLNLSNSALKGKCHI